MEKVEIPNFTHKSSEDIAKLEGVELITYRKAEREYENAVLKNSVSEMIESITKEQKEGYETQIKTLKDELTRITKANEDMIMLMDSKLENASKNAKGKSDFEKFIERDKSQRKEGHGMESVTLKVAALMTTANVLPNAANGFNQLFGNYIDQTIHSEPKRDVFMAELVDTQIAPGTENIWYVERVNEDGDAAFIGEGDAKPLIDADYQEYKADVKEVAEFWKMSKRLINHAPSVVADFRQHAQELIEIKFDEGLLTGDGTGDNLNGIKTLASAFVVPTQLANYYDYVNIFDVIMAVATKVRLNNFKGQLTCVLNTVWEAKMQGIKNVDGDYILPSFVAPDGKRVGSVNVRFENGMEDDHILLGDLKKFKCRISENFTYDEGWIDDDFQKNLESRKIEMFAGTYLPTSYAGAIIYDEIATIEAAIANTAS